MCGELEGVCRGSEGSGNDDEFQSLPSASPEKVMEMARESLHIKIPTLGKKTVTIADEALRKDQQQGTEPNSSTRKSTPMSKEPETGSPRSDASSARRDPERPEKVERRPRGVEEAATVKVTSYK